MNKKQETTPEQKPFDYNAKINSLTKQKIVSINKDLNIVIKEMQKEIDLSKQTNNRLYGNLAQTEMKLYISLKEQIKLIQQNTETIKSNTKFIKERIFLNNRNLFQRIFNVQYKE